MEETDKKKPTIDISLRNMGTVNRNQVTICKGMDCVTLYFSYQTLVAVDNICSINNWSTTTGKLLNMIEPDHKARVEHKQVLNEAQERLRSVFDE